MTKRTVHYLVFFTLLFISTLTLISYMKILPSKGDSINKIQPLVKNAQDIANTSRFPLGSENTAYQKYFIGKSWLAPLLQNNSLGVSIANVTFEPSCRNNWHSHSGGQILIAVGGTGFYQEKGKPARLLNEGDIVEIPPDVIHWHGASDDSSFAHLSISCNPTANKNIWLNPVSDQEYKSTIFNKKLKTQK